MMTVVIPTYERPDLVAQRLHKVRGADEVIVTDDSASRATCGLIRNR